MDVGAQILELENEQAASRWLEKTKNFEAAVYFDRHDELAVISRAGKRESLLASRYLSQLNKCLVFLDEAHTRGTDLVLPDHYRAAVTLGPRLTKDRLVQGMNSSGIIALMGYLLLFHSMYEDEEARTWTVGDIPGPAGNPTQYLPVAASCD